APQVGPRQLEPAGDAQLLGPRPQELGRAAFAEQQAEGFEQQRLARAGFAGPGTETGLELDADVLDEGQVLDGQLTEHEGAALRPAGPLPPATACGEPGKSRPAAPPARRRRSAAGPTPPARTARRRVAAGVPGASRHWTAARSREPPNTPPCPWPGASSGNPVPRSRCREATPPSPPQCPKRPTSCGPAR